MRRIIVGVLVLGALGVAGLLASQAVARDREYRRLITQGDQALSQGQTFAAIEAFSGAIALKGDSMLAYLKRGKAYRRQGDLASALRDLRTASHLDPAATHPLEQLGDVNYTLRRYARAAEAYEGYLKLDERSPGVLYKLALASRMDGNLSRAITALRQTVKLNDRSPEAYYLLGVCLRERQQPDEAVVAFERAISLSPALIPAREELGDLHVLQGHRREEIEQLEALAALDPGRSERLIAVGLAYADAGNPDLAVMALGRAAERFPEQPAVYAALGRVWLRAAEERGDRAALRKALEALEPIASQSTASSEVLALYGRAVLLTGDLELTERILQQATSKLPAELSAFISLANVSQRLGHFAEAREALIHYGVLSDDNHDQAARAAQIGDLSMRLNDPEGAARWFERATSGSEPDPGLLGRLAEAQFRAGQADSARATLARALEKNPSNSLLQVLARRIN